MLAVLARLSQLVPSVANSSHAAVGWALIQSRPRTLRTPQSTGTEGTDQQWRAAAYLGAAGLSARTGEALRLRTMTETVAQIILARKL